MQDVGAYAGRAGLGMDTSVMMCVCVCMCVVWCFLCSHRKNRGACRCCSAFSHKHGIHSVTAVRHLQ